MMEDQFPTPEWGSVTTRPQLGAVLQRVRQSRKLAQVDLADAAGVQRSTISAIENSRRSINVETLMRLFDVLGIEMCVRDRHEAAPSITEEFLIGRHLGSSGDE